jgi:hypothetical protein
MAADMLQGMGPPQSGSQLSMDDFSAFEQLRGQVSPTEFNSEMMSAAEQVDPVAVAEFRRELQDLNVPPEIVSLLREMVQEVLSNPADYPAIRQKYMAMGVDEELLPEAFDPQLFAALNMALDQFDTGSMPAMPAMASPQAFARGGIANLRPMAREMARAGRYGDTMIAHISPVEAAILKRYGGSGTINPATGAPEFFLGGLFKKIGSAIKKFAGSTVGKIVTAVALGVFLGPAAAAALGASSPAAVAAISGFVGGAGSTMLAGGNLRDALKAGAIGGLVAGAGSVVMKGTSAFKAPAPGSVSQLQAAQNAVAQGAPAPDLISGAPALPELGAYTPPPMPTATPIPAAAPSSGINFGAGTYTPPPMPTATAPVAPPAPSSGINFGAGTYTPPSISAPSPATLTPSTVGRLSTPAGGTSSSLASSSYTPPGGFFANVKDAFTPTPGGKTFGQSIKDAFLPSRMTEQQALNVINNSPEYASFSGADKLAAAKDMAAKSVGLLRRTAPITGLGIATLGALGGFEEQPAEIPPGFEGMAGGLGMTGIELLNKYPERYGIRLSPPTVGYTYVPYQQYMPQRRAAKGSPPTGEMSRNNYPRRNGHISGPGTGTSDDIPAMLSDGEFVFTAKAVRAMGDGSRRTGAKRMYALMKKLEGRANG